MPARILATLLLVFGFQVQTLSARIIIWVGDLDDLAAIESHMTPVAIEKRKTMVRRLEGKLLNGMQTKAELEERFGPSSKWQRDGLVRPVGADIFVGPENVKRADAQGLLERSATFPIAGVGRLLVFFDPDDNCYAPPMLFFNVLDSMPALTDGDACQKRIAWESPLFDALFKAANTSVAELTPTDGEAKKAIKSSKRIREHFDKKRRTIDYTGDREWSVDDCEPSKRIP